MSKRRLKDQAAKSGNKARTGDRTALWVRRIELGCALALTVSIILLHLHRANRAGPLWRDEIGTLSMATWPSFYQTCSFLIFDSFPLLIYTVVRLWTAVGWPAIDTSLRILGAAIGIGGLFALWSSKRMFGRDVPLLSLALFGLNATVIAWGDSLRAYGLAALLILLTYGLIWKVIASPARLPVLAAGLVALLSVQCLYQNAFLVFAICAGGCFVCARHKYWRAFFSILGIGAVSAASLLPYVPTIFRAQPILATVQFPFEFSHLLDTFAAALGTRSLLLWAWLVGGAISILIGCAWIFSGRVTGPRKQGYSDQAIFSLTILVVGTAFFLLFLKTSRLTTEPWYYIVIMSSIALSIDIAIGLAATTPARRIIRLAAVIILAVVAIPIGWDQTSLRQTNIDVVAAQLGTQAARGDFVVVSPWFDGISFQNYYRGGTDWSTAPPISDLKLTRYDLLREQMAMEQPLQPVFDSIEKTLKTGGRVWVVGELSAPDDGQLPPSLPRAPNGPNGWYSGDYLGVWTMQLGYFLKLHAMNGAQVNVPLDQPINPYEDAFLLVFSGWRS